MRFEMEHPFEDLPLHLHRYVLTGAHGERAREETADAGEEDHASVLIGACEAHDERNVRDQPIVHAEDRGAQAPGLAAACGLLSFDRPLVWDKGLTRTQASAGNLELGKPSFGFAVLRAEPGVVLHPASL
jgi:hypothetical protein